MAKLLTFTGNFRNSSAFHHRSSDYHMQVALWTLRYATHMDILIQKNLPAATLPFFFFSNLDLHCDDYCCHRAIFPNDVVPYILSIMS